MKVIRSRIRRLTMKREEIVDCKIFGGDDDEGNSYLGESNGRKLFIQRLIMYVHPLCSSL